jgi:hypothetical protein
VEARIPGRPFSDTAEDGADVTREIREPTARADKSKRPAIVSRVAAAAILLAATAFIAACFWPGHMNADTLTQISQVQTGRWTNQHAPILLMLWKPFFDAGAGPGWVLAGQVMVFLVGCYLVLRVVFGRITAAIAAVVVSLVPPVFGQIGLLGRDTWFIALFMLTFGLTIRAASAVGTKRIALIVAALVVAWLSLATRQNAAPAVVLPLIVVAVLVLTRWPRRANRLAGSGRRRVAVVAVISGSVIAGLCVGSQLLLYDAANVANVHPETQLYTYDLAAISRDEDRNLFPKDVVRTRGMKLIDLNWNPDSMLAYIIGPNRLTDPYLSPSHASSMGRSWKDAIVDHPLDYVNERFGLFARQLGITHGVYAPFHPGIDANPFGYTILFTGLNTTALDYLAAFGGRNLVGGPMYDAWIYLLVGLIATIVLLRRASDEPVRLVGVLGLSIATYQIGLWLLAPAISYRLEYPTVTISLLVTLVVVKTFVDRWQAARRPVAGVPAPGARMLSTP